MNIQQIDIENIHALIWKISQKKVWLVNRVENIVSKGEMYCSSYPFSTILSKAYVNMWERFKSRFLKVSVMGCIMETVNCKFQVSSSKVTSKKQEDIQQELSALKQKLSTKDQEISSLKQEQTQIWNFLSSHFEMVESLTGSLENAVETYGKFF